MVARVKRGDSKAQPDRTDGAAASIQSYLERLRAIQLGRVGAPREIGLVVIEMGEAAKHGTFIAALKADPWLKSLGTPNTLQRYAAIARDDRLVAHAHLLPESWYLQYKLTTLSEAEFEAGVLDRVINSSMERKDFQKRWPSPNRRKPAKVIEEPAGGVENTVAKKTVDQSILDELFDAYFDQLSLHPPMVQSRQIRRAFLKFGSLAKSPELKAEIAAEKARMDEFDPDDQEMDSESFPQPKHKQTKH